MIEKTAEAPVSTSKVPFFEVNGQNFSVDFSASFQEEFNRISRILASAELSVQDDSLEDPDIFQSQEKAIEVMKIIENNVVVDGQPGEMTLIGNLAVEAGTTYPQLVQQYSAANRLSVDETKEQLRPLLVEKVDQLTWRSPN